MSLDDTGISDSAFSAGSAMSIDGDSRASGCSTHCELSLPLVGAHVNDNSPLGSLNRALPTDIDRLPQRPSFTQEAKENLLQPLSSHVSLSNSATNVDGGDDGDVDGDGDGDSDDAVASMHGRFFSSANIANSAPDASLDAEAPDAIVVSDIIDRDTNATRILATFNICHIGYIGSIATMSFVYDDDIDIDNWISLGSVLGNIRSRSSSEGSENISIQQGSESSMYGEIDSQISDGSFHGSDAGLHASEGSFHGSETSLISKSKSDSESGTSSGSNSGSNEDRSLAHSYMTSPAYPDSLGVTASDALPLAEMHLHLSTEAADADYAILRMIQEIGRGEAAWTSIRILQRAVLLERTTAAPQMLS